MILKLDFQSEIPIYQQICDQIVFWSAEAGGEASYGQESGGGGGDQFDDGQ